MRRIILLILVSSLAGCANTKLGAMLYCPFGQVCELRVTPPVQIPGTES